MICFRSGSQLCILESTSALSDAEILCESPAGFSGVFCDVLEFRKDYCRSSGRADPGGSTGSVGICQISFSGKNLLFMIYVALMMMPFQVMMLSNYLVLDQMKLLDHLWGIILPAAFSTFPVFIMYRFFESIPEALMESARLDGRVSCLFLSESESLWVLRVSFRHWFWDFWNTGI